MQNEGSDPAVTGQGNGRRALKSEWEKVDWSEPDQVIAIRFGVTDMAVIYQRNRRAPDTRPVRAKECPDIKQLFRSATSGLWYLTRGAAGSVDAIWEQGVTRVCSEKEPEGDPAFYRSEPIPAPTKEDFARHRQTQGPVTERTIKVDIGDLAKRSAEVLPP